MQEKIKIAGMHCTNCVDAVKKALDSIDGISQVEVHLEKGEALFENNGVSTEFLQKVIKDIGFDIK